MVRQNATKDVHQGLSSWWEKFRGYLPNQRRLLTLSLEGSTVRLVICQGRSILSWISMPFNPRLLRDGWVEDAAGLAEVIRNALAKLGTFKGKVVAAFSGSRSVARVLTLPRAPEIRPEVAIPREARRLMGVVVENAYLFWSRLEQPDGGERFFVVATPRTGLRAFLETLRLSGLRPAKVELKALALARAIGLDSAIIANLEIDALDVVILKDFIPTVISNIPLEGGTYDPEEMISNAATELQQCIAYHNERARPTTLNPEVPVFLCGGHPQLEQSFIAALGDAMAPHPVTFPTPPLAQPPDFPLLEFVVNVGLILKEG